MADLQISQLPALAEAGVQSTDVLAVADLSASETKKVTVKDLVAAGVALIDAGDIPAAKVGTLGTNQVATAAIQDSAVTNTKLANSSISLGGLSLSLGSTDATPALNLSDATNYPTSSLSGTITNAQLAGSITGDKLANSTVAFAKLNLSDGDIGGAKITSASITSTQLAADSVGASQIAANAVGTSEVASNAITNVEIASATIQTGNIAAAQITASLLANNAVTTDKIQDGAVTAAKLSGTLQAASFADGSVTTAKIEDDAVTSAKLGLNSVDSNALANNSVDTDAVVNSAITDAKIAAVAGTKITAGTIPASALNTSNINRGLNVASGNIGIQNAVSGGAATKSGIAYTDQGLIASITDLAPSDLPTATVSAAGIASFPTSGGLSITGAGAVSIAATIQAATRSGIQFNSFGQIIGHSALTANDLPVGTTSAIGALSVTSGGGLTVSGAGALSLTDSAVTPDSYPKVTVNQKGIVTAGASLVEADIPPISATKITSGTLDIARVGANAITGAKLANASTVLFGSVDQTGFPTSQFTGQFFFDSVLEDLYIFDGNAYQPVTTLTKGSLIFGGTYDASQSKMTSVTAAGASKGLAVNSNLPTPSATMDGVFVIVATGGTPSAPAPVTALNPPDYILGVTSAGASSYQEIDLSATVQGQIASNVSYTPFGQLSATNVQAAINELETEKVSTTGATFTGPITIDGSGSNSGSLIFEGATADNFETTLGVVDPTTSDKTLLLPNENGTLISSGGTGTVTGTMIANDTIQNVDIKSDAAIAYSKLQALPDGQILIGSSGTEATPRAVTGDISIDNAGLTAIAAGVIVNADISNSAAIAASKIVSGSTSGAGVLQLSDSTSSTSTSLAATANAVKTAFDLATTANTNAANAAQTTGSTFTGNIVLANQKETRFSEASAGGSNYVSLKAPSALSGNVELTLPGTAGSNGQVLSVDGSGNLSFISAPSASNPTFSGDLLVSGGNIEGFGSLQAPFSSTVTFTVTVASKTAAHRYSGSGSSNGYKIDGVEAPFITLTPGRTYRFDQSDNSNSGHPLLFYLEANKTTGFSTDGAGATVVSTNGTPGSSGAYTEITVTDTTPQILHYQCSAHAFMGNSVQTNSKEPRLIEGDLTLKGAGQNIDFDQSSNLLWFKTNTLGGQSAKLHLGDGVSYGNLEIYKSGFSGPAIIQTQNTDLQIASGNSKDVNVFTSKNINLINSTGATNYYLRCLENSGSDQNVELYYGQGGTGKKLETTNTGVTITGTAVATSFTGDLTGDVTGTASQASTVNVTAKNTNAHTVYPLFAGVGATATGYLTPSTDTGLTYNPSTGELTTTKFTGNGSSLTNVDAATLDGDTKDKFVRTDNSSSSSGQLELTLNGAFPLKINNINDAKIVFEGSNNPYIQFREGTTNKAEVAWSADGYLKLNNSEDSSQLRIKDDLNFSLDGSTFYSVLHAGNVGSSGALASTNVYVNQIHGDGSNLTNLPAAGGSVDLTASGAIAANKPVIVNSSGQAEEVGIGSDSLGSAVQHGTNSDRTITISDPTDTSKYVIVSSQGSTLKLRVASVSGTTISFGTETSYNPGGSVSSNSMAGVYISSRDCYMLAHKGPSGYFYAVCFTVSGTSITMGSRSSALDGYSGDYISLAAGDSSDGWCSAFFMRSSGPRLIIKGVKPASTVTNTPDLGGSQYIAGYGSLDSFACAFNEDQGYFYGVFNASDGFHAEAWTQNSSNGNPSRVGVQDDITSSFLSSPDIVYEPNIKKMIVAYRTGNNGKFRVINYNSSTYSWEAFSTYSEHTWASSSSLSNISMRNFPGTRRLFISYTIGSSGTRLREVTINSDSSYSNGTTTTITSSSTTEPRISAITTGIGYGYVQSSTAYGRFFKVGVTNATAENFIGFANAAINSGSSGTINVVSGTTTQSGLTAGQKYYVQTDGTLSTTADTISIEAGIALSSTKLLIKG